MGTTFIKQHTLSLLTSSGTLSGWTTRSLPGIDTRVGVGGERVGGRCGAVGGSGSRREGG
eukprot:2747693-Rhodomonas_salina.1